MSAGPEPELRMELLENGLDELASAVEALQGEATARKLKRAVSDVAAGAELLLKERLRRHDWRQLFEDEAMASEGDLRRGDFISPSTGEVLSRLRSAGVTLPGRARQRLRSLRARRNRTEHFALIDTEEAIRVSTAGCLSVLLDFIADELGIQTLSSAERQLFEEVQRGLTQLANYVDARRHDIKNDLEAAVERSTVVTCSSCDEEALVLGDAEPRCLFCRYQIDPGEAADDYMVSVLGLSEYRLVRDGEQWPRHSCPGCEADALVDTGTDGDMRYVCFSCGGTWPDRAIERCTRCGARHLVDGELSVCDACFGSIADRE